MTDSAFGIYLDYAATTPVDPKVASAMSEFLTSDGVFGNPHSSTHHYGHAASLAIKNARHQVADLIGADYDEIVWTSGATEAINLAIKGTMLSRGAKGHHFVASSLEHKAVLETADWLAYKGIQVDHLVPDDTGLITPALVESCLRPDTALVSVAHVNNEVGTITDIAAIARVVHDHGSLLHVDAAQSVARLPINVHRDGVDLLSLSGHKMYGPKGVGALFVRRGVRPILSAQTHGGGQEGGLRSGTLATHQIAGFGVAAHIVAERLPLDARRSASMDERLLSWLGKIEGAMPNGNQAARVPGILNVAFEGVEAESLMLALGDIAISAGSACTTAKIEPSHVLVGLGLSESIALSSIRISMGRYTTAADIDIAGHRLQEAVTALRRIAA